MSGGVLRRAGRRTNLGLMALLVGAFATGWLAFAAGGGWPAQLTTLSHGLCGVGLLLLAPWKTVVVRRAPALRVLSLALLGVVLICLVAGFVQVFGGYGLRFGVSPIQVHVSAGVLLIFLLGWHLLRHRPQRWRWADLSRRQLLRTAGFAVATGAAYAALEGTGALAGSASAGRLATGSHRIAATDIPATNWLLDPVPVVGAAHRVLVAEMSLTVAELQARGTSVPARLDCTSGWYADATWTAVALAGLLPPDRLRTSRSVVVTSVTGYCRRFPVADAGGLWLAVARNGQPLTTGTGAPVRLVAPGYRGFAWVKWVASVELSRRPAWVQPLFPLQ